MGASLPPAIFLRNRKAFKSGEIALIVRGSHGGCRPMPIKQHSKRLSGEDKHVKNTKSDQTGYFK